jgi:4-nitrophenyl phosphatase
LSVIITATGVQPITIGKPGPILFQEALRRLGSTKENTAMVGDRLNTDIAGGNAAGLYTILVLSGVSTRLDVSTGAVQPNNICQDIMELAQRLP